MRYALLFNLVAAIFLSGCRKQMQLEHITTLLQTSTPLHCVHTLGTDTILVTGGSRYNYGSIFVSYNGGQSWKSFDSISTKALYSCKWLNTQTAVAAGYDGKFYETTDAGSTWNFTQLFFWMPVRDVEVFNGKIILSGGDGMRKGFIATNPLGINLWEVELDTFANEFRDVTVVGNRLFAAGYGLILKSNDATNWQPTAASDDFFVNIKAVDGVLYAGGANGLVLASKDDGNTWKTIKRGNSPFPASFFNAMDANESGILYAGENGKVLWYPFEKQKWFRIQDVPFDITSIRLQGKTALLATEDGKLVALTLP